MGRFLKDVRGGLLYDGGEKAERGQLFKLTPFLLCGLLLSCCSCLQFRVLVHLLIG